MKNLFLSCALSLSFALSAQANDAPEAISKNLETLLSAMQESDLKKFESICDANMQEAMTPEVFEAFTTQIAPLLKAGYTEIFRLFTRYA